MGAWDWAQVSGEGLGFIKASSGLYPPFPEHLWTTLTFSCQLQSLRRWLSAVPPQLPTPHSPLPTPHSPLPTPTPPQVAQRWKFMKTPAGVIKMGETEVLPNARLSDLGGILGMRGYQVGHAGWESCGTGLGKSCPDICFRSGPYSCTDVSCKLA